MTLTDSSVVTPFNLYHMIEKENEMKFHYITVGQCSVMVISMDTIHAMTLLVNICIMTWQRKVLRLMLCLSYQLLPLGTRRGLWLLTEILDKGRTHICELATDSFYNDSIIVKLMLQ